MHKICFLKKKTIAEAKWHRGGTDHVMVLQFYSTRTSRFKVCRCRNWALAVHIFLMTCLFMTGSMGLQILQPHFLSGWNPGPSVCRVFFLLSLLHIVAVAVFLRFKCLLVIFVMSAHFMMFSLHLHRLSCENQLFTGAVAKSSS